MGFGNQRRKSYVSITESFEMSSWTKMVKQNKRHEHKQTNINKTFINRDNQNEMEDA